MSKTASQKLLRDLNQRIGQLEHEKSLMAKYMGRLEQQLAELNSPVQLSEWQKMEAKLAECKQVSNAHCLQADNYRVKLAELELESEAHQFRVKLAQNKMVEVKRLFEKFMDGDGGLTDLGNAIDDLLPPSEEKL